MELRPGYKQSELGVIPTDWDVSLVGKEFSVQLGKMLHSEKNIGVPKPYLGNRAVQWGRVDLTEIGSIKMSPTDLKRFRLQKNDLLVCEGGDVGRAAIWDEPVPECYYQKALHRLRPTRGYNVKLMVNVLHHLAARGFLLNFVTQTSIAHLPKDKFETVPIPLPPTTAEQDAIAEALSDADALIKSLDQLITKKRQIKQGAMQELLTGKKRLPGFATSGEYRQTELGSIPKDWDVASLSKICSMKSGESITSARIDSHSEFPCYGGNGLRGFTNRYTHNGRYALIGRQGALCGNVLGVEGYFFASEHAVVVTPSAETDIGWLTCVMREMRLNRYSESSAQPGLSVSKLLCLPVVYPSEKTEQAAIAGALSDMDEELAAAEAKLSKVRLIKQGMMQELLNGRIRLV